MATVVDAIQGAATPLPTRLFTARDIGELVLQRIGAFTPMEASADEVDLGRVLEWMEIVVSDLAGRKRCQWLIPVPIEFDLEDNVSEYVLADIMGAAYPTLGIAYPISAYLGNLNYNADRGPWLTATVYALNDMVSYGGLFYLAAAAHTSGTFATDLTAVKWTLRPAVIFDEIPIVRRSIYERYENKLTTGTPECVYIDRTNDEKTLFVYPVQSSSTNMRLRLVVQTYPRSVMGPIAESEASGDFAHGFDRTWQKWLILATSCEAGDGPVRQLSSKKLTDLRSMRDETLTALMAFQNREKTSLRLQRTRRRDW